MQKYPLLFLLLLTVLQLFAQGIVINELVADNNSLADSDGDYSDWIELYNNSDFDINLENYSLSDDADELDKWIFPAISIPAKAFLLVFASSKNRFGAELHSNFKISAGGEALFLSNGGMLVDQTPAIDLGEDISFGRLPDGGDNLLILSGSSPAASNNNYNALQFSHESGFYTAAFNLAVTSLNSDLVYYSLDGAIPTQESPLLDGPLLLEEQKDKPNVLAEIVTSGEDRDIVAQEWISPGVKIDKAVVFRCASFRNGERTSVIYTRTFFIDKESEKYKLPVISLVTDFNNLFDPEIGIYALGSNFDIEVPNSGNFNERGDEWERPVHIEYYEKEGQLGFRQDAGLRIHGGISRQGAQKSLRLYARSEYGEKYFNYPLLPQRDNDTYKRIVLRTSLGVTGGEVCLKDELANDIARTLGIDYQAFQPAVVFLNGEYWGIYSIRDRLDKYYVEYTHGVDKDEVEFYEDSPAHFENLTNYIRNNDLAETVHFDYVKTQIDLNNFIDTYIAEMFYVNIDWPANNSKKWRPTTAEGKWRWIFHDIDFGLEHTYKNMFEHATGTDSTIVWPNPAHSTFLFRSLLKNDQFFDQFFSRYYEIMDTTFDRSRMLNKLDALKAIYTDEMTRHGERWHYPRSFSKWEKDIESYLVPFLTYRSCHVEKNISDFLDLPKLDYSCFDTTFTPLQNTELIFAPNPSSGYFFLYNNSNDPLEGDLYIYNTLGQLVDHKGYISLEPREKQHFWLNRVPNGSYFMKFNGNGISFTKKIMVVTP